MSSGNEILSKCLPECLIYKASVNRTINKYYFERTIKEHFNNHKCSFRNKSRDKKTELLKYVWELEERETEREREILIILLIGICYEIADRCLRITKV